MADRGPDATCGVREASRFLIAGLGNPLMADDGIGHAVVERFRRAGPLPGVRAGVLEGDVLGLFDLWSGEPNVWLIDAVNGGSRAGVLRIVRHSELLALPVGSDSAHHVSLGLSLRWLLLGRPEMARVRFRLYGIEVGTVRPQPGLSDDVEEAVERLAATLRAAATP